MAKGTYFGDDISIFLTEEEVSQLGQLELNRDAQGRKKLSRLSLEVPLEAEDGSAKRVRIQVEDFDDLGDGIRIGITDYGFLVQINDHAYWRIRDNPIFGTRYDGSNKIHFYLER